MKKMIIAALALAMALPVLAQDLKINAAEFGIGKFHRKDNKEHKYEDTNAWKAFILPEGIPTNTAYIQQNSENNYTVFYTNLEELLNKMIELSTKTGKKVSILNINAHGLPGGMWFPKDAKTRDSMECGSWRQAANNSDDDNYNQYYSSVSKSELLSFESMSNRPSIPSYQCLTGVNEWKLIVAKVPAFTKIFTSNAQVHMLSCMVGKGTLGANFTKGLATILFPNGGSQRVQTSIKLGLGDWSMPDGMGFWGYMSDAQLEHDNQVYPVNRRDADMAQLGDIRTAELKGKSLLSGLIKSEDYMLLTHDDRVIIYDSGVRRRSLTPIAPAPASVRVPGTNVTINQL